MIKNICKKREECTGCTACINICPKNCIKMIQDADGFGYPEIDNTICINCGMCERTCPINHPLAKEGVLSAYVVRHKDFNVVRESTSGGTSAAFGEYVFNRNGIFCGVGYSSDFQVQHFIIDSSDKEKIKEIRGSKYVQSELNNLFKTIKLYLDKNRLVCFTGTPCQVSGLKAFLKKDYDNLITVDLVCHGVASPYIFQSYVNYQTERYGSKPVRIAFRNKTYGYHSGTMMIEFKNKKKYFGSGRIDQMLKAYFAGACSRYCCYDCQFKGIERNSDFTVFDCWHVEKLTTEVKDDDWGYTNIYVHNEKARRILTEMSNTLKIIPADAQLMCSLDGIMINNNPEKHKCREDLIPAIKDLGFEKAIQKYLPITIFDRILEKSKSLAYKIGLLKIIRKK